MTALGTLHQDYNLARGLSRFERQAVCLVAFVLLAFNGRPFTLSSGFVCLLVASVLLMRGMHKFGGSIVLPRRSKPIAFLWAAWTLAATVSTLANYEMDAVNNLLWGYWVPFLLFLSLVRLSPSRDDFQWIIVFFAFGLALRFGYGALVFYSEWGIPTLSELLFARYDTVLMVGYKDATFGNTGNSASILAIALPVLVWSLIVSGSMKRIVRIVLATSIVILCANVLITGSRSAMLISAVVLIVSTFKLKTRSRYALLLFLVLATYLFAEYAGERATGRFATVISADVQEDTSLAERVDSMKIGLGMMFDYPLGVGPGMSQFYNIYDVAHQFAVAQGGELGILGMIIVLLLAGFVVAGIIALKLSKYVDEANPAVAFRFGAFSWIVYAMTTNIPVNSGATMPWIGMLAMFLAFTEHRFYDKRLTGKGRGVISVSPYYAGAAK